MYRLLKDLHMQIISKFSHHDPYYKKEQNREYIYRIEKKIKKNIDTNSLKFKGEKSLKHNIFRTIYLYKTNEYI